MTTARLDLLTAGHGLLEAARWYPDTGLVFSDMTNGGVLTLSGTALAGPTPSADPAVPGSPATPAVLIPHRKGIGGLVRHADGGFVLAGRNVAHKPYPATGRAAAAKSPVFTGPAQPVAPPGAADRPTTVLLETGPDEQFFNDLTADGRGRLYVGSVGTDPLPGSGAARPDGRLYRLDRDGTVTVLADDVLVSNGLAADPADERLYHVDSNRRLVWSFAIGAEPVARDVFVDTSEYAGLPDGLTVAVDGSVWVAMAGGGVVVAWDAKGSRVTEIPVPQSLVTSVTFGGPDLRTLFILTGHNHEHPDPAGGCVYRTAAPVPGLPAPACRVPLPGPT